MKKLEEKALSGRNKDWIPKIEDIIKEQPAFIAVGAAHLPGMMASHTIIPVIGVPILVYNDKQVKKTDNSKFSAFGGLDSLLSISEMPTGSPVVAVGVNKSGNAGIYAMKILANEFPALKTKLKQYKITQHKSVLKESDELKKQGLSKFVKKKFK